MRFVSKSHATLRVIEGGKPSAADEPFAVRLRAEQATSGLRKPLTDGEIEELRTLADRNRH